MPHIHINDVKSCERVTESDWTRQDLVAEQLAVHAVTRPLFPFGLRGVARETNFLLHAYGSEAR